MTKEEFIKKHCYYIAPHGWYRPGKDPENFGTLESYYVDGVDETERPKWENTDVPMCIKAFPFLAPLFKNDKFSKETKGMLAYMVVMVDYNAPGTDLRYFLEYGKGIDQKALLPIKPPQGEPLAEFTDEVQKAMDEAKAKGNPHLYQFCKFFKGEEECPYKTGTAEYEYWNLEKVWVLHVHNDEILRDTVNFQFDITWKSKLDYIDVNGELKATLFDQYYNNIQSADGFEDWLVAYYLYKTE